MRSSLDDQRRHTLILSDVHLSQAHPSDDPDPMWMRYRRSDYHPDAEFAAFVDAALEACRSDAIELVFNGDLFDFDAPLVKDGASTFEEFPLDDAGCTAQVKRIVHDHPRFFGATAKLLAHGHRVMFVSGNHDVELYWPGVRAALRDALSKKAEELALPGADLGDVAERVRFRTWFHLTEDGIYIEHGSQYDMLNGMPDPMRPLVEDASWIQPLAGKLAFKRTGSRMGYFNPYCEETFYMGLSGYLRHFASHYLFTDRHIIRTWASGSISTVLEIVKHRRPHGSRLPDASVELAVEETGASREAVLATHALRVPPADGTMIPILRELWLDRVLLVTSILIVVAASFGLGGKTAAAVAAGVLLAAFALYEILTPKPDIRTYDSAPPRVKKIFEIHDASALCMGHTHRPVGTWEDGKFWGNSGSWCPAFFDAECEKPVLDGRPFLWLTADAGSLAGGLHWFRDGAIIADRDGSKPATTPEKDLVKAGQLRDLPPTDGARLYGALTCPCTSP